MGRLLSKLRTGTKFPIHTLVIEVNRRLERIECGTCTIDHVSENGDISINLNEEFPTWMKDNQKSSKGNGYGHWKK